MTINHKNHPEAVLTVKSCSAEVFVFFCDRKQLQMSCDRMFHEVYTSSDNGATFIATLQGL